MSAIVKQRTNFHWYTVTGEPMHEVANKSGGGLRSTTLSDAKKLGLLPSVTTILGVLAKPALDVWKIEQAILSSLTLPKGDDEPLHEYAKRISEDMNEQTKEAANIGTQIHKAIEQWIKGEKHNKEMQSYIDSFVLALNALGGIVRETETRVVSQDYAGTIDLVLQTGPESWMIADLKTQNFKNGKANFYEEWAYQLSAYAMAWRDKNPEKSGDVKIANIVLDKSSNKFECKIWTQSEFQNSWEVFQSCKTIWQKTKKYNPKEDSKAA